MWGGDGNDLMDGGTGADNMYGQAGDDTYYVDNAGDIAFESDISFAPGLDTVYALVNYELFDSADIEILSLTAGTATFATGNQKNNSIYGNGLANVLDGGDGADALDGQGGNDTFEFHAGEAQGDTVYFFQGNGAAAGDTLLFVGYGTLAAGASFVHLGGQDWQITSADGTISELITLAGAPAVDASDFMFI
jgi:Ca2+-binding RTX toxin-like protein